MRGSQTTTADTKPRITPTDRLGLTFCLALMAHGIFVAGVTFKPEDPPKPRFETMQVTLVHQQSEASKDAEILAQANLKGGGDSDEPDSPSTPTPSLFPSSEPEITSAPPETLPSEAATPESPEVIEATESEPAELIQQIAVEAENAEHRIVEKNLAKETVKPTEHTGKEQTSNENQHLETPPTTPSAATLLANALEIASLSAEIQRKLKAKAKRPRRKFLSADTKEYQYAAYMEAWRLKVERVGNINYPDAARKQKLFGALILDVALNKDGSVHEITIRKSSGHKILDDAAIRIVELASPYAPFPSGFHDEKGRKIDILHITRTWKFLNNNRFR